MDDLARQVLEKRTGEPAREKIRRLFGKAGLTEDYARKMLAGMRLYIEKTVAPIVTGKQIGRAHV